MRKGDKLKQDVKCNGTSNTAALIQSHMSNKPNGTTVTIVSIGLYIVKNYSKYKKINNLPDIFRNKIESIISINKYALLEYKDYITTIYFLNQSENENYEALYNLQLWINEVQASIKTIAFSMGIARREVYNYGDIVICEQISKFQMFKDIQKKVRREQVLMGKYISFIKIFRGILATIIENSSSFTCSQDIMDVNNHLEDLINKHMLTKNNLKVEYSKII